MVNIAIAGDYCPQERIQSIIDNNKGENVFQNFKKTLDGVDYAITNLECAVVDEGEARPITKFGPCLSTTPKGIELLKDIGFTCVTLANNHFRDFGNKGVADTIKELINKGIDFVGGGKNLSEAQKVLYKTVKNVRLGIISICEHEFSLATDLQGGAAPLDYISNFHQIKEARSKADRVIVIVHGGSESWQYPSPRMKRTYQWFVDIGADVVVNHHQHCFSGYEIYKGRPIFYGLGNFCFDEDGTRDSLWNYGYMLKLIIKDDITFDLIPYEQCNHRPEVRLLNDEERKLFNQQILELNKVICDDALLMKEYDRFVKFKKGYLGIISPYQNEHVRALASRHWIPYFLPRKKMLNILNFIECESHRDVFIDVLKKQIYHD